MLVGGYGRFGGGLYVQGEGKKKRVSEMLEQGKKPKTSGLPAETHSTLLRNVGEAGEKSCARKEFKSRMVHPHR